MNQQNPKIIFFGTPDFATGILRALIENKFDVAAVFTQPDKKVGRKQEIVCPAVKKLAVENGIQVFQPTNLRDEKTIEEIKNINPDLIVVAAYGKILPQNILKIPKYGAINAHASLLPKYRGASPVQCAILSGEKETGITLMKMNERMDEGDILFQKKIGIADMETADFLLEKLSQMGAKMIVEFVPDWIAGKIKPAPQDHKYASYCKPIRREDGRVDWNSSAAEIFRKWRAYYPWPGIFSLYKTKNQPKRLKLLEIRVIAEAGTGEKPGKIIEYNQGIAVEAKKGLIVLKRVQLEGKKEMEIEEFMRGNQELAGGEFK